MNKPTKENISDVMNGFEKFFVHIVKTQNFDLKEFANFMEPIFKSAGYRDEKILESGNILILTEIGAGDFIVATSTIREIRRLYPTAYITLVVHPRAFVLAECCPYVNELILNPQKHSSYNLLEFYKFNLEVVPKLLEQRFDICFALSIHPHTPLLMYMSGAKNRIISIEEENLELFNQSYGLTQYLMHLSTHIFPYNTYGYHRVDRFLSLLENMLHLPITNRKLETWYTPADVGVAASLLRGAEGKLYSLGMGGTSMQNHYPPEKYAQLLERILAEEPTAIFVILGGGKDDLKSAAIIKAVAPEIYANNIIDLTNKIDYRQSAAVLARCQMHIGNDTGTMHLASATNCPALEPICFPADLPMRNTDCPKRWYPYGVPSIIVQPKKALTECKASPGYRGCVMKIPHCITQIEPATLLKGFHLLKTRIAKKINKPLYIS